MSKENKLVISNISKRYGKKTVVKDVSLSISPGQIVGLLGPNGAGKTTSFYTIVGLTQCDRGRIVLDGSDITRRDISHRAHHGLTYLPQDASVFRKLNVKDNIMAICELQKNLSKPAQKKRCSDLLKQFKLTHIKDTLGIALSGGERRRVEMARALATDPKYVLLDEPFAGIDPIAIDDITQMIRELANMNIGVLITDHNVRDTLQLCDHAYIVNEGQVIAEGSAHDIANNPIVKKVYLGQSFSLT
jgi:lipopolysaccharide export system ATP-binding protein